LAARGVVCTIFPPQRARSVGKDGVPFGFLLRKPRARWKKGISREGGELGDGRVFSVFGRGCCRGWGSPRGPGIDLEGGLGGEPGALNRVTPRGPRFGPLSTKF